MIKKYVVGGLKIAFSLAVLSFLVWKARQEDLFQTFWEHDKNWGLLGCAAAAYVAAVLLQFLRWRILAGALELKLTTGQAVRYGFISQLFSLVGVGMLGGDALKTYMLGKQNRGRVTEALTSVMVDRMIGLYGLILMAAGVSCLFDFQSLSAADPLQRQMILTLCWLARAGAIGATLSLAVALSPGFTTWPLWDALGHIPKFGGVLKKLVYAMRMYRRRLYALNYSVIISLGIHLLSALLYYFLSQAIPAYHEGLPVEKPSLIPNMMAALLALATGAFPVGGLELVFDVMYRAVSSSQMPAQQGFLLVLGFRLIQLCVASVGLYYYLLGRREVDGLMHDAQAMPAVSKG